MTEHTKEPWRFSEIDGDYVTDNMVFIQADVKNVWGNLAVVSGWGCGLTKDDDIANAKRIVACVNFCEGQPSDFLEMTTQLGGLTHLLKGVSEVTHHNKRLTEMYDELEEKNAKLKQRIAELESEIAGYVQIISEYEFREQNALAYRGIV